MGWAAPGTPSGRRAGCFLVGRLESGEHGQIEKRGAPFSPSHQSLCCRNHESESARGSRRGRSVADPLCQPARPLELRLVMAFSQDSLDICCGPRPAQVPDGTESLPCRRRT